jgi:hypothetical protein
MSELVAFVDPITQVIEVPTQSIQVVQVAPVQINLSGTPDGNKGDITVSNDGATFTINPSAKGQATTQSYLAAVSLGALRLVRLNVSDQLIYADNSMDATVTGLTSQAVSIGIAPIIILSGLVTDSSWNWARGAPLYLGSNGNITAIAPTSGFIVPIGNAEAPTIINLNITQGVQIN